METPGSYRSLCERLQRCDPTQLIAIEGFCSSGKSTLADDLGRDVPAEVIHTDKYCTPRDNPPPYAKGVDIAGLKQAIEERGRTKHCIIEGICLRDVLSLCDVPSPFYVYVKRVGGNGLWYDQFHLEDYESGTGVPGEEEEPHASDLAYHSTVRPHERADIQFLRIEE